MLDRFAAGDDTRELGQELPTAEPDREPTALSRGADNSRAALLADMRDNGRGTGRDEEGKGGPV